MKEKKIKNPCRDCEIMARLNELEDKKPQGFYAKQDDIRREFCDPCKLPLLYSQQIEEPHLRTIPDDGPEIYNLHTDNRGRWPRLKEMGVL